METWTNVHKFTTITEDEGEVCTKPSIMSWSLKKKYKCKSDISIK